MDYITSDDKEYADINEECFNCVNADQDIMMKCVDISSEQGIQTGEVPCGETWACTKGHSLLTKPCPHFQA